MWHRLLLFLRIRDEFEWAPPCLGPEVPHPYIKDKQHNCCTHCGGGRKHAIHAPPWNERRMREIYMGVVPQKIEDVRRGMGLPQ